MTAGDFAKRAEARASLWVPVLAMALHLGLGFVLYSSSGPDDVHITYGAAENLLHHGRITNYNGDPIEQSSSLAHVLLTALVSRLTGLSVVTTGHLLPILAGALVLPLVYRVARSVVPEAPGATTLFVACIPSSVHWSFGGLEGPLYALFTLTAVWAGARYVTHPNRRDLVYVAAALTLAAMTRPEGMLVSLLATGGLVAFAAVNARRRQALQVHELAPELSVFGAAVFAAAFTCVAHFAISRHLFPNPVLAKARGLAIADGLGYLWESIPRSWLWAPIAFIAGADLIVGRIDAPRGERAMERLVGLFAVAYLAFIATSGGDWMWGGRFIANVAPLLGIVIVLGVVRVTPPKLLGVPLALALVLANAPGTVAVASGTRTGRPMWTVPKMRELVHARFPDSDYGWFELASGVSLRDIPVSEALTDIVLRIAPFKQGPIVIASRQSGFTVYHTVERLEGKVQIRFVDLENLATDDFIPCANAFLVRDTKGALLSPELLVKPPRELARDCHMVRPDIVFGASHMPDFKAVSNNGYDIVFRQRGKVGANPWNQGHYSAYIGVDEGLAKQANLGSAVNDPIDFDWADACLLILHRLP